MEKRTSSRLYETINSQALFHCKEYVGEEVILGLEGTDEYGNKVVRHINGFIGRDENKRGFGLYEYVSEEGEGVANKIMPLNIDSPVVELMVPSVVETTTNSMHAHGDERTDLTYKVVADPKNINSSLRREYHFESRKL